METTSWPFGGPALIVSYRPEVNGLISVDVVDRPWPDQMGDPKADPQVFGAWSMGHFGPFAWPGGLGRAGQHSWGWKEAADVARRHKAFLRVRSSYVFGTRPDAPVMPPGYLPLPELLFVSDVTASLLTPPEALCYFNPNGERLLPLTEVQALLARGKGAGPLPLELWCNIRLFDLGGAPAWSFMDTVGMGQLDAPDHEACFQTGAYAAREVDSFLLSAALYVFENGPVVRNGDTMDGPGRIRWQGATFKQGVCVPPREVIRWFPMDQRKRPAGLQGES
jgi:hypothetical protein